MAFSAIFFNLIYIFLYGQNNFTIKGFFSEPIGEKDKINVRFERAIGKKGYSQFIAARLSRLQPGS